jgi:membrane protein YqaA with SNARE-associated domain
MRRLWTWFEERATTRHAQGWLVLLAFSESSFFLIPPDVLLMAMLAARAGRWVYLATLTTLSSVTGAVFGYTLGAYVFQPIAQPLIDFYHLNDQFAYVGHLYSGNTFLAVLTAAVTPIPFKVFVLAGGFFSVPFVTFITASILGRGARFFAVAWLSHRYGPRAAELGLKYFNEIAIVLLTLAAIGAAVYFGVHAQVFR